MWKRLPDILLITHRFGITKFFNHTFLFLVIVLTHTTCLYFFILGWAFYTAIIGIVLTFISGCLSMAAQKATTSDQVSKKIEEGETLVCLL